MIFVYFFIAVVIVGILIMFNTGQLTRQKMELQNAADAAAYSAATLSARYMNYAAYTNRAMIANEVAIGQFSAFSSWGARFKLAGEGRSLGLQGLRLVPVVGNIMATILQNISRGLNAVYETSGRAMTELFGTILTYSNYALNHILGASQQLMRVATLEQQWKTIPKVVKLNATDATVSNFGALAAIFSQIEQFLSFSRYTVALGDYSSSASAACEPDNYGTYDPEIQKVKNTGIGTRFCSGEEKAKQRYVAIVNDSRDTWTRDRRSVNPNDPSKGNFGIDINFRTVNMLREKLSGARGGYDINGNLSVGYATRGGTALRYLDVAPANMLKDLTSAPAEHKGSLGWSSMDTTRFGLEDWGFNAQLCFFGCVGFNFKTVTDHLGIDLRTFLSIPLGGASAELAGNKSLGRTQWYKWADAGMIKLYGDAWSLNPILQPVAAFEAATTGNLGKRPKANYAGIAPFTSVDPHYYGAAELDHGTLNADALKGPVFIVGVRKNINKLRTSEQVITKTNATDVNRFNLQTQGSGGIENSMPESGGEYANKQARDYAKQELDKFSNKYKLSTPTGFNYIPEPMRGQITRVVDSFNGVLNKAVTTAAGGVGDVFGKLVEDAMRLLLEDDSSDQPAMYALATARIIYKNPNDDNDPGSAFSPYWEAHMVPVDNELRKWSLYTQDARLVRDLQNAILASRSPDSRQMDKDGMKNYLKKIGIVTNLQPVNN